MAKHLESLQAALARMMQARAALLAAGGAPGADRPCEVAQMAVEKLNPIKRALENAVDAAEAATQGEDRHVEVVLRQREVALQQRARVDRDLQDEYRELADTKRQLGELRRSLGQDKNRREQAEGMPRQQRTQALQERSKVSEDVLAELKTETEAMSALLADVKSKNRVMDERSKRLEQEHQQAVAQNSCAKASLGDEPNLVSFRRKKAAECAEADATFLHARDHYEAFLDSLAADWAEKQAAYLTGVEEMETEVRGLRKRLAAERALASANLSNQSTEHKGAMRQVEVHVASELGHLSEQRDQRHTALRREVVQTTHQLEDAQIQAQKHLDIHLKEAKIVHQARLQREEAHGEEVIQDELQTVLAAKREREGMEKKVVKTKENYRMHAIKSKNYVKSLDKGRREQLVGLWGRQ